MTINFKYLIKTVTTIYHYFVFHFQAIVIENKYCTNYFIFKFNTFRIFIPDQQFEFKTLF